MHKASAVLVWLALPVNGRNAVTACMYVLPTCNARRPQWVPWDGLLRGRRRLPVFDSYVRAKWSQGMTRL